MIESLALWLVLRRRLSGLHDRDILSMAFRTLIASLVMGVAVFIIAGRLGSLSAPVILVLNGVVGAIIFEIAALAVGLSEARSVPATILRRFARR